MTELHGIKVCRNQGVGDNQLECWLEYKAIAATFDRILLWVQGRIIMDIDVSHLSRTWCSLVYAVYPAWVLTFEYSIEINKKDSQFVTYKIYSQTIHIILSVSSILWLSVGMYSIRNCLIRRERAGVDNYGQRCFPPWSHMILSCVCCMPSMSTNMWVLNWN